MTEITNLPGTTGELDLLKILGGTPDALQFASRFQHNLTPIAGQPESTGSLYETVRVARHGDVLAVDFAPADPFLGELLVGQFDSTDTAEVLFANTLDELRRDGWIVRSPDPWELADVLAPNADVPF